MAISQPISISVENTSKTHDHSVKLWDVAHSLQEGIGRNWGNHADLKISIVDGKMDYCQTLYYLISNIHQIGRIDIEGSRTSTTVNNKCTVSCIEPDGELHETEIFPSLNKFQQMVNVVTIDKEWRLDMLSFFSQIVPANSTIVYRFYPQSSIVLASILKSDSTIVTNNSAPRNQGIFVRPHPIILSTENSGQKKSTQRKISSKKVSSKTKKTTRSSKK